MSQRKARSSDREYTEFRLERIGCIEDPTMPVYKFRLLDGITTLGRSSTSDIVVTSLYASWNHCKFTVVGDIVQVYDMSSNGTFVNTNKIAGPRTLVVGDLVGIGCSIKDVNELKQSSGHLVFKFVRTPMVSEIVELLSDDEDGVVCLDSDDDMNIETTRNVASNCTNSSSSDTDGDDDISMIMPTNNQMEMKQEMLDLDDYLWDLQHNPTKVKIEVKTEPSDFDNVDDHSSGSHSGMLDMQQLSASGSPTIDNSINNPRSPEGSTFSDLLNDALVVVKTEDQSVDCKPIITFPHNLGETIEVHDDDDENLRLWKNLLSQRSDIGLKKSAVITPAILSPDAMEGIPPEAMVVIPPDAMAVIPPVAMEVIPPDAMEIIPPVAMELIPPVAMEVIPPDAMEVISPDAMATIPPESIEGDGCVQQNGTALLDCSSLLVEMPQKVKRHYKKRKATLRGRPPKKMKTTKTSRYVPDHAVKLEPIYTTEWPTLEHCDAINGEPLTLPNTSPVACDLMPTAVKALPAITEAPVATENYLTAEQLTPVVNSPQSSTTNAPLPASTAKQLTPIVDSLKRRQKHQAEKSIQLTEAHQVKRRGRPRKDTSQYIPQPASVSKDTVDERRDKLRVLAEAGPKNAPKPRKAQTKPKVKNTPYRGAFLTDEASLPPKPAELRRKAASTAANKQLGFLEDVQQTEEERLRLLLVPKPRNHRLSASPEKTMIECIQNSSTRNSPVKLVSSNKLPPLNSRLTTDAEELEFVAELAKYHVIVGPASSAVRPILRAPGQSRKTHRSFRFAEKLSDIREFQSDVDVAMAVEAPPVGPILAVIAPTVAHPPAACQAQSPETPLETPANNPLNEIINDITGWNPDWLQGPADMANVNRMDYAPAAMLNNYADFDSYVQRVIPIMKMEMWHCIHNEANHADKTPLTTQIQHVEYSRRSKNFRYVFQCEVEMPLKPLGEDHLVLVTYSQGSIAYKFLALIMHKEFDSMRHRIRFTMESSSGMANALKPSTPFVQIQILTHLMVELKQFKSILLLHKSPLLHPILRPADFPMFHAKGDDKPEKIIEHIGQQWSQNRSTIQLIDGRPGTGKTRLIINLLFHFLFGPTSHRPHKIIVCAHNNAAVDVIGRELLRAQRQAQNRPFSFIRFGVQDRIHPDVRRVWTDELVRRGKTIEMLEYERAQLKLKLAANRVSKDCDTLKRRQDEQYFIARIAMVEAAIARKHDANNNRTDYHAEMQYQLNSADIVLTTLNSCARLLGHMKLVDICIVDEANLCAESSVLLPLPLGVQSLVLVGDSHLLPHMGQSRQAAELGLGQSLFARIRKAFAQCDDGCPLFRLSRQYRMHPEICAWPDNRFYGAKRLEGNPAAASASERFVLRPYMVIDLPFFHAERRVGGRQPELCNVREADFVNRLARMLCGGIVDPQCLVGVITPYQKQREELSQRLRGLRRCIVDSFDTIHGLERDIVIVSAARSHGGGYVTGDRLLAALTRARSSLIVCGNFDQVRTEDPCWRSFLDDAADRKCYEHWTHTSDDQQLRRWIVEKLVKTNYQQILF